MNIKNILFIATIAANLGINITCIAAEPDSPDNQPLGWRKLPDFPSDPTKTPTSPDVIEHQSNFINFIKGIIRIFSRKRIFYKTDKSGNPCYRSIQEHAENNPEFSNIPLIIYHKAGWFTPETFENIGTYGDESARKKLIKSIAGPWWSGSKGGLWCPPKNENETGFFIGGTRETGKPNRDGTQQRNMCEVYQRFLEQPVQTSKFKK